MTATERESTAVALASDGVPGRQRELAERASDLFPGGVNSPVRAFRAVGRPALVLARGAGSQVWDADGSEYLDYIGGWGPAILGHAHPRVRSAVVRALEDGAALGATHPREIELGEAIAARMPSLELMRFTSSGTEASMSAIRLSRAATGRDLIVKFAGAYHGHADTLLVDAGSGAVTHGIPGSAGVPVETAAGTLVVPFNDADAVSRTFEQHGERIAAVIAEPVVANAGVIPPLPGFLEHLRSVTAAAGSLLILDEVITGFRVAPGGAQALYRIRPDLTVLGKIIGGGMPVGAYGGRSDVMSLVAPSGPVYQAGTLSGHPLSMAAGVATLSELTAYRYDALERLSERLERGLADAAAGAQRGVSISRVGSLLTVFFRAARPVDAAEAQDADREAYARFFGAMLDRGVLLPPSQFEAWFVSMAHTDAEIDRTVDVAREAFAA